jgi:predicted alpha/beta hydrolase family esterase
MKRLVISGFACPPESWADFLGRETETICLYDVLKATESPDIRQWSRYLSKELDRIQPDSIVCHDYGGIICLMTLWSRQRKKKVQPRVMTILNTAFKDFDVLVNTHPFSIQLMSWAKIVRTIEGAGGHVDARLEAYLPMIKGTYRRVIAFSMLRKPFSPIIGRYRLDVQLDTRIQLLASVNDPFIDLRNMEKIRLDFHAERFIALKYGHFPYSSNNREQIRDSIVQFEKSLG